MQPDDTFIENLNKILATEAHKLNAIATFLGISGNLVDFICNNIDIKRLPLEIQYCCVITAANLIAITKGQDVQLEYQITDVSEVSPYKMGEQTQERIYRSMKPVIEMIYKNMQEFEKKFEV